MIAYSTVMIWIYLQRTTLYEKRERPEKETLETHTEREARERPKRDQREAQERPKRSMYVNRRHVESISFI